MLDPCPFCKNTKIKVHEKRRGNYKREGNNYQAWCSKCHARGPLVMDDPVKAVEGWNQRG